MLGGEDQTETSFRVTRPQLAVAGGLSLALVALFVATMPFARLPTHNTEILVPAYAAATFVLEAMTAALLFALYCARRYLPLLFLASGYLFGALMLAPWALTFPGVFTGFDMDAGLQVTAAFALLRRLAFPLFVLAFALAPRREITTNASLVAISVCVAATVLIEATLFFRDWLPPLMLDGRQVNLLWQVVPALAMMLYAVDIALLLWFRRSALGMWVCIVLFSLGIELLLISYLGGGSRLSVGWWAGRLYGLVAMSIILLVLVAQTTLVHVRLARTVAAELRSREKRLTAMEALSASIAHEINQPLASMVTNADAALRWLSKAEPRIDKAELALRRIVEDGHRANGVVRGIRTMFTKGTRERAELDLAGIVAAAAEEAARDARHYGVEIAIEGEGEGEVPPVIGNAVQLHHVLRNLIENAVDAVRAGPLRARRVTVRLSQEAHGEVHVCVADTGPGIAAEVAERLFDPFITTKPGGMGMGLMFCRAVVEAHGGSIWASANAPQGAIFHFSLPVAILSVTDAQARSGVEEKAR
ncbi:signal transduction histidine kinase [Ancylobacter aquaticus]|uniref:histidine kinase n=1 Tax=Ancylobacter aquaticus TaxID=100 RepID=A0A4R1I663_ANCAQ|nr:ATP-binding protein [Ancylobacter aquaticus]TCK30854.1 signal transduction histidine kinase [Ancylobacter aquaticus]